MYILADIMDTGSEEDNIIVCYRGEKSKGKKDYKKGDKNCDKKNKKKGEKKVEKQKNLECPQPSVCDPRCPNKTEAKDLEKGDICHEDHENKDKHKNNEKHKKDEKHKTDDKVKLPPMAQPSKKPKDFSTISNSASVNCCACCQTMYEYLEASVRLFTCQMKTGELGTVSELFWHMVSIMGALGQDAINFVKLVCRCCSLKSWQATFRCFGFVDK